MLQSSHDTRPLVSVFMLAYNHEKYISQAIDSILQQRVNFRLEIVVGEDCSTDRTRAILLEYWQKNPGLFKLLLHDKNVGPSNNHLLTAEACTGKYVAMCEGDDFWTSPTKLQEQVDFLEAHPDYSLCCHRISHLHETGRKIVPWNAEAFNGFPEGREIDLHNVFDPYIIATVSVMYRNDSIDIADLKTKKYFKDIFLYAALLNKGRGFCMNKEAAIYRIHEQGVWSMQSKLKNLIANALTGLSINEYLRRQPEAVDRFAFYQVKNCYAEMSAKKKDYEQIARYFAYTLAFRFSRYGSARDRIRYLSYLLGSGWPFVKIALPDA